MAAHRRRRTSRIGWPRRRFRLAVGALIAVAGLALPATTGSATAATSVSKSIALTRTHLVDGHDQIVDQRNFGVTVSETEQLRDRQTITVSWSGAHPTGGIVADQQSGAAADEEYPVVVMQCRGVDSSTAPAAKRLSPQTCWTHTPTERYQADYTGFAFPPFRLDRYATTPDRGPAVNVPSPDPAACPNTGIQHWLPFVAADGHVYPGGDSGCGGMAPEAVNVEESLLPSNTTYGVTDGAGNGSTKFVVNTQETNASLGCSQQVPCSLVVVPIEGISCDPAATSLPAVDQPKTLGQEPQATTLCEKTGAYQPGTFSNGRNTEDLSVSGELWWSASNWRNHVSIPLGFSQPGDVCTLANTSKPLLIYGSELMAQATSQWAPAFCLNSALFKFQHVLTAEPEAKNLLGALAIEGAFEASPPDGGFANPTVQAPTAITGFAVAVQADKADHSPAPTLNLDARLLAKLLTESYPSNPTVKLEYHDLANNPFDIVRDPEFQALNPGFPTELFNSEPASTLFTIASSSDVMSAVTSYINSDPEARAWLDGKPDPWGMVVNPNYQKIALPVDTWQLLDSAQPASLYNQNNPCLQANKVPWLPLVANPLATFAQVTLNMQFSIAASQIVCSNAGTPTQKLASVGRETAGQRFILGVIPLADALRYQIPTAALQTASTAASDTPFTSSTGRTFVGPTTAGLTAAAKLFTPDKDLGTWTLPYSDLPTKGTTAYPGTMLISTDVPTRGLPATDAAHLAEFLRFVAGKGQATGFGNGQIPAGYLPLTAANGLGPLVSYTNEAAADVAAQNGKVPVPGVPGAPQPAPTTAPSTGSSPPPPSTGGGTTTSGGSGGTGTGTTGTPGGGTTQPVTTGKPPQVAPPVVAVVNAGRATGVGAGLGASLLPIAAMFALVLMSLTVGLILTRGRGARGRRAA